MLKAEHWWCRLHWTSLGLFFQCSSCSQQFMQKKDLQSHMIKLHGAPKPHAVSARRGWGSCGCRTAPPWPHLDHPLPVSSICSAPLVPSASCLGQSYSCTRLLSIAERSSSCVRSVGTGPRAATGCRCTSRPSTGMDERMSAPLPRVRPCQGGGEKQEGLLG